MKKLAVIIIPLCISILFGFYIGAIIINGNDIRIKELEISTQREQENKRITNLKECLTKADQDYDTWLEINMEKKGETYWGEAWKWEKADELRQNYYNNCYSLYK